MITSYIRRIVRRLEPRLNHRFDQTSRSDSEKPPGWYDSLYAESEVYDQPYYRSFYYFLWAVIVDRLHRQNARKVLEIGCGPGQLATLLLEQGIESYVGMDFSPRAISMARLNAPKGEFFVDDARTTKLHDEVVHDVTICTEVLEHIEDDLVALTRFKSGTRCLFSVPSFPYPSHVRHFQNPNEVQERYGPYFHDLSVTTFKSPNSRPNEVYLFFLAEGVRNDVRDVE